MSCCCAAKVDGEALGVGASVGYLHDDGFSVAWIHDLQPCPEGVSAMGASEAVAVVDVSVCHASAVESVVVVRCHTTLSPQFRI